MNNESTVNKKNKILKIIVFILCIIVAAFFSLKALGYDVVQVLKTGSNLQSASGITAVSSWKSEKTEGKYNLKLTVLSNDTISLDYGISNTIKDCSKFTDLISGNDYANSLIMWDIQICSKDAYAYISVVPKDCSGAVIDNVFYESNEGTINIGGIDYNFRYVLTDLEVKEDYNDYTIELTDFSGNTYTN